MNRRTGSVLAVLALTAAACAAGPTTAETESADAAGSAPGTGATTTTVAETTTTTIAAATTATTQAPAPTTTTTTEAPVAPSEGLTTLQAAISQSAAVTSGRMEGIIQVTGLDAAEGPAELTIPFGGAFDNAAGNFSFYMDMSGIAAAAAEDGEITPELAELFGDMEVRQIGETAYLKFPLFTMLFGAETEWISMPADEDATGGFVMTSPSNPSEILESFQDVGATVEVIGAETVNGVQATHYRAVFDMEALLAEATPEERARLEAQGPLPTDAMPMDLWISDAGHVVRFVMEIDGSAVEAAPGESFDRMLLQYDLFDLGESIVIEPPPAAEVTDLEDLEGSFGFDA